ncbi:hypothetical protein [Desulfosporosinus sp. OT]|uniref:hypothetical protein n=1 Tax=Desulfosporosinus sp. OT TaxID=913865 RepID=UPI0002E50A52|nr:hypothetical protein [Desulfosporosinus sp. OT]
MKLKQMAGTISIIVMLSTPTLAQAQVASGKSEILLMDQSLVDGVNLKSEQANVLQAKVETSDINTTGLTNDEIKIQFKAAGREKHLITLQERAKSLDIDITDLSNDQARKKIKAAERANTLTRLLADAKTLGIGIESKQSTR